MEHLAGVVQKLRREPDRTAMSDIKPPRTTVALSSSSKWKIATIVFLCMTPVLSAQRDVRAPLLKPSARTNAPAFELAGESGAKVKLSHYRGKVILVNFWATDCGGCVLEVPILTKIERDFQHDDFTVVGIDMDIPYDPLKNASEAWNRVRPFMATHGMNYPVLMGDSAIGNVYRINAYPASFVIDKSGRIAAKYVGIINSDDVEANVRTLLDNK